MKNNLDDTRYMRRALRLAACGLVTTSPNPSVGAVLVKDNKIISEDYHRHAGEPHAEILALQGAGEQARGSTLYITLEPCCHQGRTPPCTRAIISAGVNRVVAAMTDPNPLVSGNGFAELRNAKIVVQNGLLEREAIRLNESYIRYIRSGRPFVELKAGATLDGRIATRTGESKWITSFPARRLVHRLRLRSDAVVVGSNTVISDNPSLNVRYGRVPRQPAVVVVDSRLRISPEAKFLNVSLGRRVFVYTSFEAMEHYPERVSNLRVAGVDVIGIQRGTGGLDLKTMLKDLGKQAISRVFVEGGGELIFSFLHDGLADKVSYFIAPMFIGGRDAKSAVSGLGFARLSDAVRLSDVHVRRVGLDYLVQGYLESR